MATYLFLGPAADFKLQIWAPSSPGRASFTAGAEKRPEDVDPGQRLGLRARTIALIVVGKTGAGVPGIAVIVGVTVAVMILGAHVPLLAAIPAAVYGYASTAAFGLLVAGADPMSNALQTSPFLNISASMIIGALFGYVSASWRGPLPSETIRAVPRTARLFCLPIRQTRQVRRRRGPPPGPRP